MKENMTDVTIILDRSGSMYAIAEDTIGSINRFVSDQSKVPGSIYITLNQFNDSMSRGERTIAKDFTPLNLSSYAPNGSTALLDAIGQTINERGEVFARMQENDRPSKVIVVIMTDGEENASTRFSKHRINEMILHQQEKYKWEFVFLGANQDSITEATKLGIFASNAINFSHSSAGSSQALRTLSAKTFAYHTGVSASMAYSPSERAEADAIIKSEGK